MTCRAATPEAKREVIERLLAAWCKVPDLRLGQLLVSAAGNGSVLFYAEDSHSIALVEYLANAESLARDAQ